MIFTLLIIYFVLLFIFVNYVYIRCTIYYKPYIYTDPKTGEKIDVHKKYEPFQSKDKIPYLKFLIGGMTFFPFKIVGCMSCVFFLVVHLRIVTTFFYKKYDTDKEEREKIYKIIHFWSYYAFKIANIKINKIKSDNYEQVYKKYLGENYDFYDNKYSLITSNHLGLFDVVLHVYLHGPGFIAKKEVGNFPFFGSVARCLNCILVERGSEKARKETLELIYNRQKNFIEGKTLAPLVVFPEGTTTCNRNILKFKKGAFYHLMPIKPHIIKIDQSSEVHIAIGTQNIFFHTCKLLCFWKHNIYYMDLPVIRATDYMFEHYKNLGKEKWEIYAEVARKIYCEIGGFKESDYGYRDSHYYHLCLLGEKKFDPDFDKKKNC